MDMVGRLFCCVAVGVVGVSWGAAAQSYTFKTVKAPMSGSTILEAINNVSHQLSQVSASGSSTCTLLVGATKTVIADPTAPGGSTVCLGLSTNDTVVGYFQAPGQPTGASTGFIYSGGTYSEFNAPGASLPMGGTQLNAISANGLIAGTYSDAQGLQHVFTIRAASDTPKVLLPHGQHYPLAVGIDNAGGVSVQTFDGQGNYTGSYFQTGAAATQIVYPGSVLTVMHGINTAGMVAGHYVDSSGLSHGFLYDSAAGSYSGNIDAPSSTGGTLLFDVNDSGKVCGSTTPNPQTSIRLGLVGTPS